MAAKRRASADLVLPTVEGGWRCIVADPPWSFRDKGSRIAPELCRKPYHTLGYLDVAALPVRAVAAPDAYLFLWAPDTHVPEALEVAVCWGFTYKHLIPWVKVGKTGKLQIGMGHYLRKAHEVALLCTRGRPERLARNIPSVIFAPRGRHSAKPEAFQDAVERFCGGPRLELFARRGRPGWTAWGDQLDQQEAA